MLTTDFWRKYFKVYDVLNLCIPYQELVGELVNAIDARPGEKILDAGGGTGNVAVKIAERGAEVMVFDFSKEALEICQQKNSKIKTVAGDLTERLPFPDNYFDKVVSNNTIYTILPEKRSGVISEIYRILKPDGKFVVSNIKSGFKPFTIYKEHIKKAIKKDGFLKTSSVIVQMLWPTIKMFYYNAKIKKESKDGSYSFLTAEEQDSLIGESRFKLIRGAKIVYAEQGSLTVAEKLK